MNRASRFFFHLTSFNGSFVEKKFMHTIFSAEKMRNMNKAGKTPRSETTRRQGPSLSNLPSHIPLPIKDRSECQYR
jgi:hypothetical protein